MISSRWKKVWADFWGNKSRTFLTILTIMVGTFAVGFINNLNLYLIESMDGDFLSASPSEAKIQASPMDDDTVKIAKEVPGIDALAGLNIAMYHVVHRDGKKISIQLTAIENPYDLKINTLKPAGESSIPPLGDRQVDRCICCFVGYKPGDMIVVELDGGKQRKLRLAGYMHDAAGFPYSQTQIIDAYITPKTMEWLGGSQDYNVLAISVAENPTDQEYVTDVAQAVADRIEDSGATIYFVNVYQPGHHFAYTWTQSVLFIMRILGWLTVILSSFLIVNTITALMTQQTRQIGIMKATGGGTLQIFSMYIILILGFGLIALLIAIPLANAAAQDIGNGMAEYLSFYSSPFRTYPSTLVQQIIVALVLPFLAVLFPVLNSVRVTVREALTDYGIRGNIKRKKTSVSRTNLLIPRPIRLSLRNAFRRKARLSLTLATLVLGGAIFISIYNLWASFDQVVEEYKGYYLSDINCNFGRAYRFEKVAAMAKSVPWVGGVEGWMEYPGTLIRNEDEAGTQIVFIAPPSNSTLLKPIITSGRWLTAGDDNAIVISNQLLRIFPDLKVGDWLTIKIDEKESNGILLAYTPLPAGKSFAVCQL
jgi:putative ABC transport system permease protein